MIEVLLLPWQAWWLLLFFYLLSPAYLDSSPVSSALVQWGEALLVVIGALLGFAMWKRQGKERKNSELRFDGSQLQQYFNISTRFWLCRWARERCFILDYSQMIRMSSKPMHPPKVGRVTEWITYICLTLIGVVFLWSGAQSLYDGLYKDGFRDLMISFFSFSGASEVRSLFLDVKTYFFTNPTPYSATTHLLSLLGIMFFLLWLAS